MMIRMYLSFDLLIEAAKNQYRLRVLASPMGEAKIAFTLIFVADELHIFLGLAEINQRHLGPAPLLSKRVAFLIPNTLAQASSL